MSSSSDPAQSSMATDASASTDTVNTSVSQGADGEMHTATTATGNAGNGEARPSDGKAEATAAAPDTSTGAASSTEDLDDVATLRSRIADLTNQVTGLNGKLVSSFMRISDLEDDLSDARERVMSGTTQVASLEKERQEHLAALNTGLLVEKAHVSTEMTRMMDRVIEETKQRGQAESDKAKIEAELDELSASLFNEANRMVAVERLARARAEEKSKSMEERLQDTEGIMLEQQKVLGDLQKKLEASKEAGEAASSSRAQHQVGSPSSSSAPPPLVLMLDIVPYQELHAFLAHLRKLRKQLAPFYNYPYDPSRPYLSHRKNSSGNYIGGGQSSSSSSSSIPTSPTLRSSGSSSSSGFTPASSADATQTSPFLLAGVSRHKDYPLLPSNCESLVSLSSQLSLPFIKRCQEEDSDPCLRLDFAPGLNWLSRRQANTAILDGQLVIEPVFPGGKVEDEQAVRALYRHLPPAACALCGMHVVNVPMPGGADGKEEGASATGTPDLRSVTSWASSMAGSAASSLREAAGGSSTPGASSSSQSLSVDSSAGGDASSSSAAATTTGSASPKPPTLKTARSGLFSSLSSLRAKAGSPKLPLWADGSASGESAPASDAASSTATTPGASATPGPTPNSSASTTLISTTTSAHDQPYPLPVPTHIFRLSETATSRYLLCPHHCLARLRAACAFWGYLRSLERQIVLEGKGWDEDGAQERRTGRGKVAGVQVNGRKETLPTPLPVSKEEDEEAKEPESEATPNPTAKDEAADATAPVGEKAAISEAEESSNDQQGDKSSTDKEAETDTHSKRTSNGSSDDDDAGFHDAESQGHGAATPADDPDAEAGAEKDEAAEDADDSGATATVTEDTAKDEGAESEAATDSATTSGGKQLPNLDVAKANEGRSKSSMAEGEEGVATPIASSAMSPSASASSSSSAPPVPPRRQQQTSGAVGPPALPARRDRGTTLRASGPTAAATTTAAAPAAPADRPPQAKRTLRENASHEEDSEEESDGRVSGPATSWEEKVWLEVVKHKRAMWEARAGFEMRSEAITTRRKEEKALPLSTPAPVREAEAEAAGPEVVVTAATTDEGKRKGDEAPQA
ncbi:hypothetical protein BDZ90DRAFT_230289 [Jaminaea rosea]|uniref:GDP/GTP exchange factor Sec2 N-terminal domain-containing protein n=1 Tax=Jaminaea rosea TaxID=1569628 RepID=A0A316UZR5_9BASI|nr:hypothetical protein BDZ90DRAFT_230289 [Jaminaea rosea]PWN29413.1 hypothetical protein BDZ90DRAFT_230289 [Jaminaea rosea]